MLQGFFMEGAIWNRNLHCIDESINGQLNDCMPIILLKPIKRMEMQEQLSYETPVYKTSRRQNISTNSGHSNNFVTYFTLKSQIQATHWLFRGVALLCQLND